MIHKNMVALILAGGQGSRLGAMTKKVAKPAVPFGGKYRIIDFALSNCSNSGIDTVGILTQYRPQQLSTHIGIGTPWDLDRIHGGVSILPPYMSEAGGDWYRGTANAVYQNLGFLDQYDPSYVLILSGDHIYKMDYRKMLSEHIEKKAEATIAVIDVPLSEASRFGIMNTDKEGRIVSFEEKPAKPKSTLASMGIYIFSYANLKKFLSQDANDPDSDNDFGKNIIPAMIASGQKLIAYRFDGYWKDVGTVQSYWEANMDLLKADNDVKLFQSDWKLYTETASIPSQYIGPDAELKDSIISEGCVIEGQVDHSVIFPGVYIGKNSRVVDSIVMANCRIEENVIVNKSILLEGVTVKSSNAVGDGKEIAVIDEGKVLSGGGFMD